MPVGDDPPRPLVPSNILLIFLIFFIIIIVGVFILNPDLDDGERGAAQRVVGGLVRGAQVERVPASWDIPGLVEKWGLIHDTVFDHATSS